MFIRKVLKFSFSMKHASFSSQNAFAYHLSNVEKLKDTLDTQGHIEDKLFKQTSSLSNLLINLQRNKENLDGPHIVTAMSTFYRLIQKEASDSAGHTPESCNIECKEDPFYKEILDILKSNISKLSGPETVQILYYTRKLKDSFELDKIFVDHLQKNVKNLSFEDFKTISSLFRNSRKSKDFVILKNAMLRNFITRVSMYYQKDDIDFLANGLYFLSSNSCPASSKISSIFIEDLCNYKDSIPLDKALVIHDSLCYLHYANFTTKSLELLRKVEETIIKNIDELALNSINFLLYTISQKIKSSSFSRDEFYNADFIDKLALKMVSSDAGFENALSALGCLNTMRHCNIEILNYVCASHFEKVALKNEPIENHNGKLLGILHGLANANYKSMFWDEIEYYVTNEHSLLDYDHRTLCVLCLHAVCLGCHPTGILEKVFDNTYDYSKDSYLHWTFCKVYQKIKANPTYEGPKPTESQVKSINTLFENFRDKKTFPLLPYLEEAIGNCTYVKTNVCSKPFILIDHVVAFDRNGLPVSLESERNISDKSTRQYLEDLKVPSGCQVVLVVTAESAWYFRNTKQLIGTHRIFVDILEKMGYKVVDVNMGVWSAIPDKEKKAFILSKIKSKLTH